MLQCSNLHGMWEDGVHGQQINEVAIRDNAEVISEPSYCKRDSERELRRVKLSLIVV